MTWGLGISSFLTIPAFLRFTKMKEPAKSVKMLTQDGKLVEVDVSNIPEKKEKIKTKDIHTWITGKKSTI